MTEFYDNDFTEQMTRVLHDKIHLRRSQLGTSRLDERAALDVIISGGLLEILRIADGEELHFFIPDEVTHDPKSAFWVKVPRLDSDDLKEIGELVATDDALEIITITEDLSPILRLILNLVRYLSNRDYEDHERYFFKMRPAGSRV